MLRSLRAHPINLTPTEARWVAEWVAMIARKNWEDFPFPKKLAELSPELQELWKEKYAFNQSVLKLNEQKAGEAAWRTIQAFQESEML